MFCGLLNFPTKIIFWVNFFVDIAMYTYVKYYIVKNKNVVGILQKPKSMKTLDPDSFRLYGNKMQPCYGTGINL